MTDSAKLLKNYYEKEGNKIVFRNGMNLNQLALAMWEKMGYGGVDASALSRIMRGERNFTYKQLQVFCEILKINQKEKRQLEKSLAENILQRYDIGLNPRVLLQKRREVFNEEIEESESKGFHSKFIYAVLFFYIVGIVWRMKLQFHLSKTEVDAWGVFMNFIPLIIGVYGIYLSFKKCGGLKNNIGRSLILISGGLLGAWIGMTTWAYYNIFVKRQVPYPSWADLGFVSVIPFYTLGVVFFIRAIGVKFTWRSMRERWLILVIPVMTLTFSYFLFLKNVPIDLSQPIKTFLDFAYPLGEAIPITIALIALVLMKDTYGRSKERILYLIFALFIQYLADYIFLYQVGIGVYYDGSFIDLIYSTAYVAMGLVLYTFNNYNFNFTHRFNKLSHFVKAQSAHMLLLLNKLRLYIAPKIMTGYFFLFIFWLWLQKSGFKTSIWNYLYSLAFSLIPLMGGLCGISIIRTWKWSKTYRAKAILYISLGLISWSSGSMIWVLYYNFFLQISVPYPSFADVFYISSYPFWIVGMVNLCKAMGTRFTFENIRRKAVLISMPIAVIVFSYYFLVIIARQGQLMNFNDSYQKLFFDLAYPLGDILILTVALLTFGLSHQYLEKLYRSSILSILLGFVLMYFADFLFSYTTTIGTFYNGSFTDLFFTVGLFFITRGLLGFAQGQKILPVRVSRINLKTKKEVVKLLRVSIKTQIATL